MTLSRRERTIAIVTAIALGVLLGDQYILTPLLDSRDQLDLQHQKLQSQLADARRLMMNRSRSLSLLKRMKQAGLAGDGSVAESQLLGAMRSWSQQSGLTLSSVRPDRTSSKHNLNEISFQAVGDGNMRSIVGFLAALDRAEIPVRISELQIASRTDGVDDLTVQLRVSTLWDSGRATADTRRSMTPASGEDRP